MVKFYMMRTHIGLGAALAAACFAADTGSAGSSTASGGTGPTEAPVPGQASGLSTTETDSSIAAALASTSTAIESLKNDVEELKTRPEAAAVDLGPIQDKIDAVTKANDANASRLDKLEAGDLDERLKTLEAKVAAGGSGVEGTAASFLKNAEMEADKLVGMVTHLWKQNGNASV